MIGSTPRMNRGSPGGGLERIPVYRCKAQEETIERGGRGYHEGTS